MPLPEANSTYIYALCEPGTRAIRYIGKTDGSLKSRCLDHVSKAKTGTNTYHSGRWIRKLLKMGQRPEIHALCQVPKNDFSRFEKAFIAVGRKHGLRLTNISDGGDCGFSHTPGTCAKLSAALKGRKFSPEHCAKLSAAGKGRKLSAECRAKLSAASIGKKKSPEHCANMSAARKGKKLSPGHCAAMSAATKGKKRSPHSPETRAKIGAAHKGKKLSPEHCAKIGAAFKGKKLSPEHRAKISAGQRIYGEKAKLNFPNG